MNIALIAHDRKKELMVQFCMAYCGILAKHNLCATGTTGKLVSEATGLKIEKYLPGMQGGEEQIAARVSYNEIDLVLFFRDPMSNSQYEPDIHVLARLCDMQNIPIATNSATAEMLILGLDRGDLDWRNIVNPSHAKSNGHPLAHPPAGGRVRFFLCRVVRHFCVLTQRGNDRQKEF